MQNKRIASRKTGQWHHCLLPLLAAVLCQPLQAAAQAGGTVTTSDRPWLTEAEFDADATLHAVPGQTVVLDLEGNGSGKGQPVRVNTLRLHFDRDRRASFCIPADEPHILRLKLQRAGGATLLNGHRGGRCEALDLAAGNYTLQVYHDASSVPASGRPAFLHIAHQPRLFGSGLNASTTQLAFLTIRGPNGKLVTTNSNGDLVASATSIDASTIWRPTSSGTFNLRDGNNQLVLINPSVGGGNCSDILYTGYPRIEQYCTTVDATLQFVQSTGDSFRIVGQDISNWNCCGGKAGFLLNASDQLLSNGHYTQIQTEVGGDDFTADYRGFTCAGGACDASQLTLQQGEVALFTSCNYQGTAYVFTRDVSALSAFNTVAALGYGIGDNQAASVRVGPDTLAVLHSGSNFTGSMLATSIDIPCLNGTPVDVNQLSSLQVDNPESWVVSTRQCTNCILPGIDLSGLDMSGADFAGSNLTGANLSNTDLALANLDDTILAKADIAGASLNGTRLACTDLSQTDLSALDKAPGSTLWVVIDSGVNELIAFDGVSGNRVVFSGSGFEFGAPSDIDREAGGTLVIVDTSANALVRVALSGVRTVISSSSVGNGPALRSPVSVAVAADGTLVVGNIYNNIFTVDPVSGNRVLLSGSNAGSGPQFQRVVGLASASDGTIYVVDAALPGIFAVDPVSGARSVLSGPAAGTGPAFVLPLDVVVDSDGSLLVTDGAVPAVFRVDVTSGARSIISGSATGTGPALTTPAGLFLAGDGSLLVSDDTAANILRVDPLTGNRELVTGAGTGSGPLLVEPDALAILGSSEVITTDFSCQLDLTEATLDLTTFALDQWRYLNLTRATINDAAGATLSTIAAPLDLSGVNLSGVDLSDAVLDGANLGCFEGTGTVTEPCPASTPARHCSTLQRTVLTGASLKRACLGEASMEGVFLSDSNLDSADMRGAQLQAQTGGKVATLEGAFMRNVRLSGANLTGVTANYVNFFTAPGGTADATNITAPGANFSDAYLAFADFSGPQSNLQSTIWGGAMLLGANFSQADLTTNTSGGVNSGTNTTFLGAYLQGAAFSSALIDAVSFEDTYWDAAGSGGSLNLLIPKLNLQFSGYWKDPALPECPQSLKWASGTPPPMYVTDSDNTCPNGLPGPCDAVWDMPRDDISLAFFQSADPPAYPLDPTASAENQCSSLLTAPNPYDLCWTTTSQPPPTKCAGGM